MIVSFWLSELTLVKSSGRTALGNSFICKLSNCPKPEKCFAPALKKNLSVEMSSLKPLCCSWIEHLCLFHTTVKNRLDSCSMNTIAMCSSLIPLNVFENTDSDGTHNDFVGMLTYIHSQMFQACNEWSYLNVYLLYLVIWQNLQVVG